MTRMLVTAAPSEDRIAGAFQAVILAAAAALGLLTIVSTI